MTNLPEPVSADSNPSGLVELDAPCRRCGYNLRGMPARGQCPECGTPIGIAGTSALLRFADSRYLNSLRWGVRLILLGSVAVQVAGFSAWLFPMIARDFSLALRLAQFGAWCPKFVGAWLLTTPDPSGIDHASRRLRHFIRVTISLDAIYAFGIAGQSPSSWSYASRAFWVIWLAAAAVNYATLIAMLTYLASLANRLPDAAIAKFLRIIKWGFATIYGLYLVRGIAYTIFQNRATAEFLSTGCLGVIMPICAWGLFLSYLFLLWRFSRRLAEQQLVARELEASASANVRMQAD